MGTKEYRQPEWVTQMEEMREALNGMFQLESLSKKYLLVFSSLAITKFTSPLIRNMHTAHKMTHFHWNTQYTEKIL